MNCAEMQELIDGYVDDELDLSTALIIERHLPDCPNCRTLYQDRRNLQAAFKTSSLYYTPPPALEEQLKRRLHQANRFRSPKSGWFVRATAGIAATLLILVVSWSIFQLLARPNQEETVLGELVTSHIRSLMVDHLADVASTDQHTVKPWFSGKLSYAPPVINLTSSGFPLIGGRLDYFDNQVVAVLIYKRGLHTINLYVIPQKDDNPTGSRQLNRQGYNISYWVKDKFIFWAISDLEPAQLAEFSRLIQADS